MGSEMCIRDRPINDLKTNGGKEFKDIKENLLLKKFKYIISRG